MLHKVIKGFENYLVTDTGRVYSIRSQKYLKGFRDKDGYITQFLYKNGKRYIKKVHRLVAEAFIPNPENKPTVDHINRIRTDNRACNLRWANYKEQTKNSCVSKANKENKGTPIIEVVNDEVSVGFVSLNSVNGINVATLSQHVRKGETDFTCKGRHFKLPKQN